MLHVYEFMTSNVTQSHLEGGTLLLEIFDVDTTPTCGTTLHVIFAGLCPEVDRRNVRGFFLPSPAPRCTTHTAL